MTHQIDVLSAQKCSCLSRYVRARLVVVKSDPSSAAGFLISWNSTGKQMVVYHSQLTLLRYSNGTNAKEEKKGDHLLGSASCASNFCWIWLILKYPYSRLLFARNLWFIRVNPRFITSHDIIDVFRRTAIVFRHKPFFEQLTNCVGSKANIFF